MTKSQALPPSDSIKKNKLNVDENICAQNGKKKKKKKREDEVCENTEKISMENIQIIQSADSNTHEVDTEIRKHKKKKRKAEGLESSTHVNGDQEENICKKKKKSKVCVPVENTNEQLEDTHKQEDHTKKKKKRKHKDSEAVVPESDPVTPQETETNTHTAEERAEKKQKKRKKSTAEECVTNTHLNGALEENSQKKTSEVCVENTNEQLEDTHTQEDHTQKKKKKKKKHKDSEAVVPESDLVTPQETETNTHTSEERAEKKQKKRKKSTAESSGDASTSVQQEPSGVEDENGLDEEDPEKELLKAKLRKREKMLRKKEEKRKLKKEGGSINPPSNKAQERALEYLKCWSEKREEWRFMTVRQIWLLKNMYDSMKVPDDHFEVLLEYLEPMRGKSRELTLKEAEVILCGEGQGEEADTEDAEKRRLRAKQIIQLLS